MKQKMVSSLALAAALTALGALSAFAKDVPAEAKPGASAAPCSSVYKISVEGESLKGDSRKAECRFYSVTQGDEAVPGHKSELKTDQDGRQYLMTEDGEKVYISIVESDGAAQNGEKISLTPRG